VDRLLPVQSHVSVKLPDGRIMQATHFGFLKNLSLPSQEARKVFFFPELECALLSVSLLCEVPAGITVQFADKTVTVVNAKGKIVLAGSKHGTRYIM
jgi:hypothetical protein